MSAAIDESAVPPAEDRGRRWRLASWIAVAVWIALMLRLMIADVWDETNGMLYFSNTSIPLGEKLRFVLTRSLGFWRPLATLLPAVVLHLVPDFDVSWRLLRGCNILLLLGALWFFEDALRRWTGPSPERRLVFTVALLFSGSAVITAGWFANVFDASVLLLVAAGVWMLSRRWVMEAGLVFGVAFFCKETAVLALPLLVMLWAAGHLSARKALQAALPALVLGAVYFALRSQIVPFGSASDVHQFDPARLVPTLDGVAESLWRQTLKAPWFGYVWLGISLAALRRPRLIAAALGLLAAVVVIYWGMVAEYRPELMSHINFAPRLYLVPAAILLFVLALERRTAVLVVLLIPILHGAFATYRDHQRFQRTYARIYHTAREASQKPLTVHYPMKPLQDTVRGVVIGDDPGARVIIVPGDGRLLYR